MSISSSSSSTPTMVDTSKVEPLHISDYATREDTTSPEEQAFQRRQKVIKSTWRAVQFGLDVKATKMFYDRLFTQFPSVRSMFPDDMEAQYQKLYAAISLTVKGLDNVEDLIPVLKDLGIRHRKYGVIPVHYEAVTECFLWTLNAYILDQMPHNMGMMWALDVADAWEWALTFIGTTMSNAAEEAVRLESLQKRKRNISSYISPGEKRTQNPEASRR
jgi:hemoglobin-like flavoprotein